MTGATGGSVPPVDGHPGCALLPGGHRRAGGRIRTAGRPHLDPSLRRRPLSLGGRSDRAHPLPAVHRRRTGSVSDPLRRPDRATPTGARWFLEPVDYLSMCFTGTAAASHASMVGAWLTDNRHRMSSSYDPVLVARSGVDPDRLPPLRRTGTVIGTGPARGGRRSGAPRGAYGRRRDPGSPLGGLRGRGRPRLPGPSGREHQCLDRGTGAVQEDRRPLHQVASVPGLAPGRYLIADNHETGGACLDWVCGVVPGLVDPDGRPDFTGGHWPWPAGARPGASGVLFTPWLRGERSPVDDRHARAGFHNLSLTIGPGRPGSGGPRRCGVQQPMAPRGGGAVRQAPARPGADGRGWGPVGPVVPDPCRRDGPDHRAGGRRRCWPTCGGRPSSPAMALGAVLPSEVGTLVGVDRVFGPTRPHGPSTTASSPSSRGSTVPSGACSAGSTANPRRPGTGSTEDVEVPVEAAFRSHPGYHGRRRSACRSDGAGFRSRSRGGRVDAATTVGTDCGHGHDGRRLVGGMVGAGQAASPGSTPAPTSVPAPTPSAPASPVTARSTRPTCSVGTPGATAVLVDGRTGRWAAAPSIPRGA